MMHTIGDLGHVRSVQAAADKLLAYPRKLTKGLQQAHDMVKLAADAKLLTGCEDFAERWVAAVVLEHHATIRKHPTKDLWAYPVDDRLCAALRDLPACKKLSADELLTLDIADEGAEKLDKTWEATDVAAVEGRIR